jgi:transcriptional regulator with XRE-family HTH domain
VVVIRQLRERAGLTQADVANLIGVRRATIGVWEHGQAVPTKAHRRRLAQIYKVTLPELELGD